MKSFLKWLNSAIVLSVLIALGSMVDLVLLGRAYELGKSDWSGWVQAIGAIFALAVAIYVSNRQHMNAVVLMQTANSLTLQRRLSSVLAVIDQGNAELSFACDRVFGHGIFEVYRTSATESGTEDIDLCLLVSACDAFAGKAQFSNIIEVINRVPMHELGSAELVRCLFQVRDMLSNFEDHLKEAHADPYDQAASSRIWNGAHVAKSILSSAREGFCAEAKRLVRETANEAAVVKFRA